MRLHLDFETYSECDIKLGSYAYAAHPSTEVLCLGWAVDDGPVEIWQPSVTEMPHELESQLYDTAVEKWAYNAPFERLILRDVLDINIHPMFWRCAQVYAYSLGFSGNLDSVLKQSELGHTKDPDGKRLIKKYCQPQPKNHKVRRYLPQEDLSDWLNLLDYCRQDVEVERELVKFCDRADTAVFWGDYTIDQQINDRGMPVDLPLVRRAEEMATRERAKLMYEAWDLTGCENPNSRDQMLAWLELWGVKLPDLTKETVAETLEDPEIPRRVREALELRQQLAKGSVTKWRKLGDCALSDRRIHGVFQYIGAGRTGRWAGRLFQPQNLPRPTIADPVTAADIMLHHEEMVPMVYDRTMDVLASTIRGAISPAQGRQLVVSDLVGIEGVLAGWFCNCAWINECYKQGRDMYRELASILTGVSPVQISKEIRNYHKPVALGGQYQLGWKGLIAYGAGMGVTIEEGDAQAQIRIYRQLCFEVMEMWHTLSEAAMDVTNNGGAKRISSITMHRTQDFVEVALPSGRSIWYFKPEVRKVKMPWKDRDGLEVWRMAFTYMGKNQKTNQWTRLAVHGGSLLENIIQAMGRDVLMEGLRRADQASLDVIGHVHDEILVESPNSMVESTRATLESCMTRAIDWAPGLSVMVESYISHRYRKG